MHLQYRLNQRIIAIQHKVVIARLHKGGKYGIFLVQRNGERKIPRGVIPPVEQMVKVHLLQLARLQRQISAEIGVLRILAPHRLHQLRRVVLLFAELVALLQVHEQQHLLDQRSPRVPAVGGYLAGQDIGRIVGIGAEVHAQRANLGIDPRHSAIAFLRMHHCGVGFRDDDGVGVTRLLKNTAVFIDDFLFPPARRNADEPGVFSPGKGGGISFH